MILAADPDRRKFLLKRVGLRRIDSTYGAKGVVELLHGLLAITDMMEGEDDFIVTRQ